MAAQHRKLFGRVLVTVAVIGTAAIIWDSKEGHRQEPMAPLFNVSGIRVKEETGALGALTPPGGGVVLVLSTTCPHCLRLLEQFARLQRGPIRHLRVVAFQGGLAGQALLDSLGIAVTVPVAGPAGPPEAFARKIGLRGTPLLIWVSGDGRVVERLMGELSDREASRWLTWMDRE